MAMVRAIYVTPADREDDLVAWLWVHGTLGVQVLPAEAGTVRLEAYFDGPGPMALPMALPGARWLGSEAVPAADWLAPYRAAARPFAVGERLLLDPRDPEGVEAPSAPGRSTLRIPARAAFGTGSHESTRLALELLEGLEPAGRRVLDVGTGTGVLALAALAFGARWAVGFDVDPAAPCHAGANARLNGLAPALLAGTFDALAPGPAAGRFDLALVNVIPEEVAADLPRLAALLAAGGEAVVSGVLAEAGPRVLAAWAALGFEPAAERMAGEWVAFRLRRTGAHRPPRAAP